MLTQAQKNEARRLRKAAIEAGRVMVYDNGWEDCDDIWQAVNADAKALGYSDELAKEMAEFAAYL